MNGASDVDLLYPIVVSNPACILVSIAIAVLVVTDSGDLSISPICLVGDIDAGTIGTNIFDLYRDGTRAWVSSCYLPASPADVVGMTQSAILERCSGGWFDSESGIYCADKVSTLSLSLHLDDEVRFVYRLKQTTGTYNFTDKNSVIAMTDSGSIGSA